MSKLLTRLLNHADDDHGAESGPALWGTTGTSWAATGALCFWSLVLGLLLFLAMKIGG